MKKGQLSWRSTSLKAPIDTWLLAGYIEASYYSYAFTLQSLAALVGLPDSFPTTEYFRSFTESRSVFTIHFAEARNRNFRHFSADQWVLMRKKEKFFLNNKHLIHTLLFIEPANQKVIS
jgi:hypothetical protein